MPRGLHDAAGRCPSPPSPPRVPVGPRATTVLLALSLLALAYGVWLAHAEHSPPAACYLTGCHFTPFGWRAG